MAEPREHDELFNSELRGEYVVKSTNNEEATEEYKTRGWTPWLIITGLATTIGASVPVGYNIGVVNAPADMIKVYCNESMYKNYNVVLTKGELEILWSAIVSIYLVGGVTGSLSGSLLADKIGRKGAYTVSIVLNTIAGILFFICKYSVSFEILMIGRLLAGLGGGLITCVVPMYLTEIAPLYLRGAMGTFCPLGVTFGVLVGQVMSLRQILGTEETWPELLSFYVLLIIICATILPFFPESPKYLYVVKRQHQMALRELSKIRGLPTSSLSDEISQLQSQENSENNDTSWSLAAVLKDRTLLLPLLLMCSMQAGQQFSGINAVFYYSVSIFKKAGLDEQASQLATIGAGGINSIVAVVAIPLMSRCNRRGIFMFSCGTASICLIILGLCISFIHAVSWMPYLCIVAVLAYVFFYQIGLGPIPYFIGSELFEIGPRSSAMALGSMANWGGNFIIGMSFPTMQSQLGAGSFGVFAIITLCLLLFIGKYFPETRGRDPSEIALLCKDGLASRPLDASSVSTSTSDTVPVTSDKLI